jgi:hypothetical protein
MIVYNKSTGEIIYNAFLGSIEEIRATLPSTRDVMEGDYTAAKFRVSVEGENPTVVPKTQIIGLQDATASVNDTIAFNGIPPGTYVTCLEGGEPERVDDGIFEFSTDLAGSYTLAFIHPLYASTHVEVTVS